MSDELPLLLRQMSADSAQQLAEDVHRYGARVLSEGLGRRLIEREFAELGVKRCGRLAAWAAAKRAGVEIELPAVGEAAPVAGGVVVPPMFDDAEETDEELIERRVEAYRRLAKVKANSAEPKRVRLSADDPIALVFFGDMHLDDKGCNWPRLKRDMEIVNQTPGMYACNLGDLTNNWQGRLSHLWAHQDTTAEEADRLIAAVLRAMPWLAIVTGNHDEWGSGETILSLLRRLTGGRVVAYGRHEVRLELVWPGGHRVRVVMRHTFKGSSIWNSAHGPLRASKLDPWAHIYIQGHHHESVAHNEAGADGVWRFVGKASGYKDHDSYAAAHGFSPRIDGGCLVVICDPHAGPADQLHHCWDVSEAAWRLTALRERRRQEAA